MNGIGETDLVCVGIGSNRMVRKMENVNQENKKEVEKD